MWIVVPLVYPTIGRCVKVKPSACSANQEKEKGHGMISVNDGSQVIANPVSEALSRKDLTGGIDLRRVNDSYEENCCFGQSPTKLRVGNK